MVLPGVPVDLPQKGRRSRPLYRPRSLAAAGSFRQSCPRDTSAHFLSAQSAGTPAARTHSQAGCETRRRLQVPRGPHACGIFGRELKRWAGMGPGDEGEREAGKRRWRWRRAGSREAGYMTYQTSIVPARASLPAGALPLTVQSSPGALCCQPRASPTRIYLHIRYLGPSSSVVPECLT